MHADVRSPSPVVMTLHPATSCEASRARTALALLRLANARLQRDVLAARSAQHRAEHQLQQQTQRLAVVAHELSTPLTALRTAAALLHRAASDKADQLHAVIARQTDWMTRVVDDLLDLSRVATGKLRLLPGRLDVPATVEAALEGCRADIEKRGQTLRVSLPPSAADMQGDSVRLAQILGNLVGNASKYTSCGGNIWLTVERRAGDMVFIVADNGIGIAPQALLKVFDPFVQEEHAVSFNHAGLGLGLAVVRELVQAHGGRVEAHSEGLGCGSRFTVTIPSGD